MAIVFIVIKLISFVIIIIVVAITRSLLCILLLLYQLSIWIINMDLYFAALLPCWCHMTNILIKRPKN